MLRRFPEVRSIHWAVNDTPAEVTNLPTVLLWGEDAIEEEILGLRFRVRPNAFLQTNTEMAETLYSIAREFAGLTGQRDGLRPLLRHGHDRARARPGCAARVWGVEISEESVACAIENAELNGITNAAFFAGNVSLALEELQRTGRRARTSSSSTRRGPGSPARRCGALGASAGAAHRLRLVQPDDARIRPEGAARGLRLRARSLPPGRHVPAHAAHRDGQPARARRTGARHDPAGNPVGETAQPLPGICIASSPGTGSPSPTRVSGRCAGRFTSGSRGRARARPSRAGRRSEQEAEGNRRKRREAGEVEHVGRDQRQREQADHREPCPAHPQREAARGREEEREEEDVGRADVRRSRPRPGAETRSRPGRRGSASPRRRSRSGRARPRARRPTG